MLEACRGPEKRFDYRKACWKLVEVRRVRFESMLEACGCSVSVFLIAESVLETCRSSESPF